MNRSKTMLLLVAVTALAGLGGMTAYAISIDPEIVVHDERKWVQNIENHGGDPTTKPGYDCAHGKMSFGCNHED